MAGWLELVILKSLSIQTILWLYKCLKFSFPWFAWDQTWAHSRPSYHHYTLTILLSFDRTGQDPLPSENISLTNSIQHVSYSFGSPKSLTQKCTSSGSRTSRYEVNHCSQLTTDERSSGQFVPQCPLTHSALLLLSWDTLPCFQVSKIQPLSHNHEVRRQMQETQDMQN